MKKINFLFVFILINHISIAQDSTWINIDDSLQKTGDISLVKGTFKATQIINTPTVEAPGKGGLQFLIMHRFGRINEGGYALFGLDNAVIRFVVHAEKNFGVAQHHLVVLFDGRLPVFRKAQEN